MSSVNPNLGPLSFVDVAGPRRTVYYIPYTYAASSKRSCLSLSSPSRFLSHPLGIESTPMLLGVSCGACVTMLGYYLIR